MVACPAELPLEANKAASSAEFQLEVYKASGGSIAQVEFILMW